MANDYDRIFKENIEALLPYMLQRLLGLDISSWENVVNELPLTLERKPDFSDEKIATLVGVSIEVVQQLKE